MAFTYFSIDNFTPFFLEEKGGFAGTIQGAMMIFFAYLGFDFITCLAEESQNPRKDMPTSIKGTIIFCTAFYCLIAASLSGMAKIHTF
jgi:APA family basic amino acid/polyamine antiporter